MNWRRSTATLVALALLTPYAVPMGLSLAQASNQIIRQHQEAQRRLQAMTPEKRALKWPAKVDSRFRGWWTRPMLSAYAAASQARSLSRGDVSMLVASLTGAAQSGDPPKGGPATSGEAPGSGSGSGTSGGSIEIGAYGLTGETNTATGNLLSSIPIFQWGCRGNVGVDFTLFHNSTDNSDGPLGTGWTHSYDMSVFEMGFNALVLMPNGLVVPFEDEEEDGIYTRPAGFFGKLEKLTVGGVTNWKLTMKSNHVYSFGAPDSSGFSHLTKIADRYFNAVNITRDSSNRVTSVKGASTSDTRTLTLSYNSSTGKLESATVGNRTMLLSYGTENAKSVLSELRTQFNGAPTSGELYREFDYDSAWNITSEGSGSGGAIPGVTYGWTYDTTDRVIQQTDGAGRTVHYAYTDLGSGVKKVVLTYADGTALEDTEEIFYTNNNFTKRIDCGGFETELTYDSDRNVTQITQFMGIGTSADDRVTTATYGGFGEPTSITDPEGNTAEITWRTTDYQVETVTLPGYTEPTTINWYDEDGRLWKVARYGNELMRSYVYDEFSQVSEVWDGRAEEEEARITKFTRDVNGDVTSVEDASGVTTNYTYELSTPIHVAVGTATKADVTLDFWKRAVLVEDAEGNPTTYSYSNAGLLYSVEDADAHSVDIGYDGSGLVDEVSYERGTVTESIQVQYDVRGRRIGVTNARRGTTVNHPDFTTRYFYDDNSNVRKIAQPQVKVGDYNTKYYVEEYEYDGADVVISFKTGEITTTTGAEPNIGTSVSRNIGYTYDKRSFLTAVNYDSSTPDVTLQYDDLGRIIQMVDGTGTTTWEYDANSLLLAEFTSPAGTVQYGYSALFDDLEEVITGTSTITYGYDAGGRLNSITSPNSEVTTFQYDTQGRLSKKLLPNGLDEVYTYFANDRLETVKVKNRSTSAVLDDQSYTYTDAGLVQSHTQNTVTTNYAYDQIGQLLSETRTGMTIAYTYDGNGNRLTKTVNSGTPDSYSYDLGDKLIDVKQGTTTLRSYTYDADGRRLTKTVGSAVTTYAWNEDSRLTGIDLPTGSDPSYTYNGAGTRAGRTAGSTTNTFKRSGAGATASVLSDSEATYVPGLSERRGTTTTYSHSGLKNATAQSQGTTSLTSTRLYDAFGAPTDLSGTFAGPFGYGGAFGYQATDGGLQLLGHRYYDPDDGRFISRDPIKAGHNWYAYCRNNPIGKADPTGLIEWDWNQYFSDVGDVIKGYGDAINPVNIFTGATMLWDIGWKEGPGAAGRAFLIGFTRMVTFWEAEDARDFGNRFGGTLIAVATALAPFREGGAGTAALRGKLPPTGKGAWAKADVYHDVPYQIASDVYRYGKKTKVTKTYTVYRLDGYVNGKPGTYEVGVDIRGGQRVTGHVLFKP